MNWKQIFGSFKCSLLPKHELTEKAEQMTFDNPDFKILSDCIHCGTPLVSWTDPKNPDQYWIGEQYHEGMELYEHPQNYIDSE